ncbi:hypothetical protein FRC09_006834, partial [Ceratobasidium sp. 395]
MRYHSSLILALVLPCGQARVVRRAPWCTAGDSCWPSSSTWSAFNESIGGRLVAPRPPAWSCHDPNYDEAACADVKSHWADSFWRANQTGAMQGLAWESPGCDIESPRNVTCDQGFIPTYSVAAVGADDISKAVKFASKNSVKLVVKNTGHDYLGRSSGAGTLSVWTHRLKDINFTDSFVPSGCPGNDAGVPAVTVGAGTQWLNVYEAANERNVLVVGGGARSVGAAGGWLQGGGHSPLGGLHGMGVDNVLQFTVVKANGDIVSANRCKNKDLFWALRGGGSTYGIVLDVTYKTHPPLKNAIGVTFGINATDSEQMIEAFKIFMRSLPTIMDKVSGSSPNVSVSNATFQGLWDWASNNTGATMDLSGTTHPTFFDWFNTYISQDVAIAASVWVGSRLVSRKALLSNTDELAKFILGIPGLPVGSNLNVGNWWGCCQRCRHTVYRTQSSMAQGRSRQLDVWDRVDGRYTPEVIAELKNAVTNLTQGLSKIAGLKDAGYFNEADPNEPNWKRAWFGSHYDHLLEIKKDVDPKGLFSCNRC